MWGGDVLRVGEGVGVFFSQGVEGWEGGEVEGCGEEGGGGVDAADEGAGGVDVG